MRGIMDETIIVQDKDESILNVLKLALEMEGFHVIPVMNCDDDILDTIEQNRPHVVVLDYRLEGKDCIDICHKIKDRYPHLPVIAISCNVGIDLEAARAGFDAYIRKPFDLDLLYNVIRKNLPGGSRSLDK
jgi:DNA-binding response OmpR family regulator